MRPLALALLVPALAQAQAAPVPLPPPPAGAVRARAPGKPRLAVLDFTLAGSAHPDLARVLADAAARGAEGKEHQVITQGEVSALLGLERMRQIVGCEDRACLADVAGALDAERLVSGSLTILERTSLLTVRVIETRTARTTGRATGTLLDATEKELVDAARRLAHEALTGKKLDTSGVLRIAVDRPGASVTLDGKEIGQSPLREKPRVLEGPHAVTVQKQGFVRWSSTIAVPAGAEVPVEVQLVPVQLMGEQARSRLWTWGWVSAGVAVAGAAAGATFGKLADDSHSKYKAAATRTAAADLHDKTRFRTTLANVSWGVGGAAALASAGLLGYALYSDAKAAQVQAGVVPAAGGAAAVVAGRF